MSLIQDVKYQQAILLTHCENLRSSATAKHKRENTVWAVYSLIAAVILLAFPLLVTPEAGFQVSAGIVIGVLTLTPMAALLAYMITSFIREFQKGKNPAGTENTESDEVTSSSPTESNDPVSTDHKSVLVEAQ